jgi:hypothetical protein
MKEVGKRDEQEIAEVAEKKISVTSAISCSRNS